jgi:hypothetical protein
MEAEDLRVVGGAIGEVELPAERRVGEEAVRAFPCRLRLSPASAPPRRGSSGAPGPPLCAARPPPRGPPAATRRPPRPPPYSPPILDSRKAPHPIPVATGAVALELMAGEAAPVPQAGDLLVTAGGHEGQVWSGGMAVAVGAEVGFVADRAGERSWFAICP